MGVEPTSTAWEAVVLPINYIRGCVGEYYSASKSVFQVFPAERFTRAPAWDEIPPVRCVQ